MARRKAWESRPIVKGSLVCLECGVDMVGKPPERNDSPSGPGLWRKGPVVHCLGSPISFGSRWKGIPHHGHKKYACRNCKKDLGCDYCTQRPSELVCTACHDWGLLDGELAHGKMIKDRVTVQKKVTELVDDFLKIPF